MPGEPKTDKATMAQGGFGTLPTLRNRWWAYFYKRCLVGFPWFWPARPRGVPVMVAARRLVRRHFGDDHHPVNRALAQILTTIAWPPAVLVALWQFRQNNASAAPIERVPGALWAAMRHNILPAEYFAYGLWRRDRKVAIDSYFYGTEAPRILKLLNRPLEPNPIDDKLAFYELCKAHALPSPEVLAAFGPTGELLDFDSKQLPKRDLFIKSRIGSGSEAAERFRWQGAVFESNRGCCLKPDDLGGYLATRARTENRFLLVQPALSNHPDLRLGGNANLATARLVTGLSTDGQVIPIFSFFIYFVQTDRLARVALVDVSSGQLMPAAQDTTRLTHQLDIGLDEACILPEWDTVLRHVKVAHQACSSFAFVGWDVALTEQGPMLLEGNGHWGASEYQRLRGEPLGYTKFAEILAMRLHGFE